MKLEILNLIPKGLVLEVFQSQEELVSLVDEELSNALWRPFIERVLAEMKKDEDEWTMWEGFWHEENTKYQTEIIVGALHMEGTIYTRGMRVKHVPVSQIKETQDGLITMMNHYLVKLSEELKKQKDMNSFTSFGDGKTKRYQCAICKKFWPASQFGQGYGHNPMPVLDRFEDRCCDQCNMQVVTPARLARMRKGLKPYEGPMNEKAVQDLAEAIKRGDPVAGINPPPTGPDVQEIPLKDIKTVWDKEEEEGDKK
jgi:hypothetical protein